MTMTSSSLSDPSSSAAAAATTVTAVASTHDPDMHRQPLQLLDQQQQQQLQLQDQHHHPHQLQHHHHHQLQHQLQHQQKQWSSSIPLDEPSLASKPITLNVSRFSRDCTASVVFCLRYSNQTTLAPWSSIYIPKNYRLPIPGQRQSSPGECDLVLKIFPRLAKSVVDPETYKSQDLVTACDRCKIKKRDTFQVVGPDPAVPSPQRLFFSTGREVRLFFKICCPPSHHVLANENFGYIVTFELHHGKNILMSETIKNAGPGMVPEALASEPATMTSPKPMKRRLSSPPPRFDSAGSVQGASDGSLPNKRLAAMSLSNLVSDSPSAQGAQIEKSFAPSFSSADPSSPTSAVVPLSPRSLQHEHDEASIRSRNKSLSYDDHAPSSWTYNKEPASGAEPMEETHPKMAPSASNTKPAKKRQEPHELSELGIGQRASANLHAAYVSEQLKERSKAGLPTDGIPGVSSLLDSTTKGKNPNKPKPQHACPEPDCDKSFSRLFNLRSHMRTHSKARPFVCSSCNFAFSRRHDRDRHAKKHLSEKPYKCIVCEATFVRQDALVRHLRMDGVQNQCMAAMEQRSMLLSSENANGYMLAAKQQAHDEQQQEDQKGADDKQGMGPSRLQEMAEVAERASIQAAADEGQGERANHGRAAEGRARTEESDMKDQVSAKKKEKPYTPRPPRQPEVIVLKSKGKQDIPTRPGGVKGDNPMEKQDPSSALSRPSSPRHERLMGHDAGHHESHSGYDTGRAYATPRYENGSGHPDYADDRGYGAHARSFYPSPSRSHSRSHSQSQPYPVGPDYHPHGPYHESPHPPPPPHHDYHGYRQGQSGYAYGHPPHRYRDGHPPYNEHGADRYGPYPPRDPGHERERPSEGTGPGSQRWTGEGPEEPDKVVLDAALNLMKLWGSH